MSKAKTARELIEEAMHFLPLGSVAAYRRCERALTALDAGEKERLEINIADRDKYIIEVEKQRDELANALNALKKGSD